MRSLFVVFYRGKARKGSSAKRDRIRYSIHGTVRPIEVWGGRHMLSVRNQTGGRPAIPTTPEGAQPPTNDKEKEGDKVAGRGSTASFIHAANSSTHVMVYPYKTNNCHKTIGQHLRKPPQGRRKRRAPLHPTTKTSLFHKNSA